MARPARNSPVREQKAATDARPDGFLLNPPKAAFPGGVLPAPLVGGPADSYIADDSLTLAKQSENGLPADYYGYLVTGGTGLKSRTPDTRIANVNALPTGPFQLTNGDTLTYNDYAASPVHRFYQMWQQMDCGVIHATADNPSGCAMHLFSWVETTVGAGSNGVAQPPNFSTDYAPGAATTGEGSTALGFYNVQNGDAPYFKELADKYAMSDNFHQSVNGGTGANHIMLGHADMIWFSDGNGHPAVPPHNEEVWTGHARRRHGRRNRKPKSSSEHEQLVYGGRLWRRWFRHFTPDGCTLVRRRLLHRNAQMERSPALVQSVHYLSTLYPPIEPRCEEGHYYLLNNYNPGYFGNGNNAYTDTNADNTVFTIPPSSTPASATR